MTSVSPLRAHIRTAPADSWLTIRDLADRFGSRDTVAATLRRARDAGEVVAVHRGIYWKGQRTCFGMTAPDTITVGLAVARNAGFTSGVGPTGWTASNLLGLSTQIPRRCHLAVPGQAPAPPQHVQFHSRSADGRAGLNFLEVAVLEILTAWPNQVEADWPEIVARVRRLAADGTVDLRSISDAAEAERDPAVRWRASSLIAG